MLNLKRIPSLICCHLPTQTFFIGTESWLTEDINNNEIFPPCYMVHRKDRPDGYGGVFFGCRNAYTRTHINISNSSQVVTCKIDLEEGKLIVIAVYRPPNNNLTYAETLCETIERVAILTVLYG